MKLLHSTRTVDIPEGLSIEVKARQVRVKGPRGEHLVQHLSSAVCAGPERLLNVSLMLWRQPKLIWRHQRLLSCQQQPA